MADEVARIHVKMGSLDLEYEGRAEFIETGLMKLMADLIDLYGANQVLAAAPGIAKKVVDSGESSGGSNLDHSTYTIAVLLGVKTGPDLVIAAAANLTLSQGREAFSRKDILEEMKAAKGYYKTTYRNNLSSYLERLLKADRLRSQGADSFSLSAAERTALETALASK